MHATINVAAESRSFVDATGSALNRAVDWVQETAPQVADKAMSLYDTAQTSIAGNAAASTALAGITALAVIENAIGPVVRENEVALFRSRTTDRLTPLLYGRYGLHRQLLSREEKKLSGVELNGEVSDCVFHPSKLVNERNRLSLSEYIYEFANEDVQTSDGAVVIASGSVNFRLDAQHVHAFVNYALDSFAQSFRQRVRSAIFNEIGRQRRDAVIGHQTASCGRIEGELVRACEGAPGASEHSGLGVVIERVNLLVSPEAAHSGFRPPLTRSENGIPVTIDSIRWLNDMIKQEDVEENRQFLREAFGQIMEASRTIEVARQLGSSGNLIIATPDETGLTKGAAAAAHLQAKDQPAKLRLVAPSVGDST